MKKFLTFVLFSTMLGLFFQPIKSPNYYSTYSGIDPGVVHSVVK